MAKPKNKETKLKETVNLSAKNAEKAYILMDQIVYDEKSLYDVVFNNSNSLDLDVLTPERRKAFFELSAKIAKEKNKDKQSELSSDVMLQFPELIQLNSDNDFIIKKHLRMNAEKCKQLAELYLGKKPTDMMEAVEQSQLYISFLREV